MDGSQVIDASDIVGEAAGPFRVSYNSRDLLIYALGIGCAASRSNREEDGGQLPSSELRYLYEGHQEFCAFPTYPLVLPSKGESSGVVDFPGPTLFILPRALKGVVDPGAILHYDQSLEILEPLDPRGAVLEGRSVVLGLYQRRGGVLVRTKSTLADVTGRILATSTQGSFLRGLKLVTLGRRSLSSPLPVEPPDVVANVTVSREQALLYRLSGDYNALHADTEAARAAGLDVPILHGLCSLGIAARQVLLYFCQGDPSSLKSLSCRFSKIVLPGDQLQVRLWGRALRHDERNSGMAGTAPEMRMLGDRVIRFEVRSPRLGAAVVVADGRAVVVGGGGAKKTSENVGRVVVEGGG